MSSSRRRNAPRRAAGASRTRAAFATSSTREATRAWRAVLMACKWLDRQPRSREMRAISASPTTLRNAGDRFSCSPTARAARPSSTLARGRPPSCAIAMLRGANGWIVTQYDETQCIKPIHSFKAHALRLCSASPLQPRHTCHSRPSMAGSKSISRSTPGKPSQERGGRPGQPKERQDD
jgi:hypothetical protein